MLEINDFGCKFTQNLRELFDFMAIKTKLG